jgi:signal transduction histidine kinase
MPDSAIDSAEALRQIQSHWLSNVVHELASPLQVARGYTRLVLEDRDNPLTGDQRRYLSAVLEGLAKLIQLGRELNDFPSEGTLDLEQLDLRTLLDAALADGRLKHASFQILEPEGQGPLQVIGDRGKLVKAVHEFFTAAVEFTGPENIVEVVVREETEKITVQFSSAGQRNIQPLKPAPDVSQACQTWRLHGGRAWVTAEADEGFLISCELPVVR